MRHPPEDLYEGGGGSVEEGRSAQRAARSLAASVAKLHGTIALPAAAQRLLAATESEDFAVADIIRILETDPALTGRLIRQVNSSSVGGSGCSSITQAVTLLGVRRLRTTALTASALELFGRDEEPIAASVAVHAARTGTLARVLAPHCGLAPDEMYACGLLHDVGKLMLLRGADPEYRALLAHHPPEGDLHLEERRRYGFDHAVLGGHVLTSWKVPQPLARVVAWHHQPSRAYRSPGKVPRMVALLRLADGLAALERTATPDEVAIAIARMPEELGVLGFADEVLPRICTELMRDAFDRVPVDHPPPAAPAPVPAAPAAPAPAPAPQPIPAPPLPSVKASAEAAVAVPTARKGWAAGALVATGLFVAGSIFGRLSLGTLPTLPHFLAGLQLAVSLLWVVAAVRDLRPR